MKIVVYSKPGCVQCTMTTRALDARGLTYDYRDVTQDEEAMAAVLAMGFRTMPVVVAGELRFTGFRPDLIVECSSKK